MLKTIEIEPKEKATASVIWLHGLGASGDDFAMLVNGHPPFRQLPVRYVFPHAPVQAVTINNGMTMPAWYDILGMAPDSPQDVEGIKAAANDIGQLIEAEIAKGIPSDKIILAGFSQGGAIALYTGLCYDKPLGGIMALSTYLPIAGHAMNERCAVNQAIDIFMVHGELDEAVPLQFAEISRDLLRANDYSVSWHQYPARHEVTIEIVKDSLAWLQNRV